MRPRTLTVAGAAEELAAVEWPGPHLFPVSPRREEITPEHLGLGSILQKYGKPRLLPGSRKTPRFDSVLTMNLH